MLRFVLIWYCMVCDSGCFLCVMQVSLYSVRFRIFLGTEFPWLVQKESESVPGFVLQMRLWIGIGLEWGV